MENLSYRIVSALIGLIFLCAVLGFAISARADDRLADDALLCQNIFGPFVKIDERIVEDGLMLESFAHTEDGPVIIQTLSIPSALDDPLEGYALSIPLFYMIDLDSDGVTDKMLVNRTEKQGCSVLEDFNEEEALQEQSDVRI
jgi:hypothetical protein